MSLADEMEFEDTPDEILIPETPSPIILHGNKRQQQLANGSKLKKTCLEKAFSTMTTSNSCNNGKSYSDIQNQENVCPKYNSIFVDKMDTINYNATCSFSEPNGKILTFPNKTKETSYLMNGKIKHDSQINNFETLKDLYKKNKPLPRKRSAPIIYSSSDDDTDNDIRTRQNRLDKNKSNCQLKNQMQMNNLKCKYKSLENNERKTSNCLTSLNENSTYNKLPDINNPFNKKQNFNNTLNSQNDINNKQNLIFSCNAKTSKDTIRNQDIKNSHIVKNKYANNNNNKQSKEHEDNCMSVDEVSSANDKGHSQNNETSSSKNCKISDMDCVEVISTASTSFKNENAKSRCKHTRKGKIIKCPIDNGDSDVECFDAKCEPSVSDTSITKKTKRKARKWKRPRMEYLSSDSESDSIVCISDPSQQTENEQYWRNTESPDPVEQVRQMEEDEKLAYRLQAQYDAEAQAHGPNLVDSEDDVDCEFDTSYPSGIHVDVSNSSDTSSVEGADGGYSFVTFSSNFPSDIHRLDAYIYGASERFEDRRRSDRLRQQSFMNRIPLHIRTALTSVMSNFPEDDYETLLQLTEHIGDEVNGLKKQQINSLPTRKYSSVQALNATSSSSQECQDCTICLCEYQNNDLLRLLPCSHEFHATCIDRWLKSHRTCPICRIEVTIRRQYNRKRKA